MMREESAPDPVSPSDRPASDRPGPDRSRCAHANQWVLVDARFQLLAVGSDLYRGTSPRSALDITARHVLGHRLRSAAVDGVAHTDSTRFDGVPWETRVIPIKGPVHHAPLAVLGCYGPDAALFPPEPTVGAWEWKVTPPGPDQEMRTYWSGALFDVYGISRPGSPDPSFWEGPQWLDELVVDADRAEIRRGLDAFLTATTDALFFHSYRVRSPTTGQIFRLRYAGRSYVAEGPTRWFRGVSTRIDHPTTPQVHGAPGTQDFVNAAFAVSADPLCAIDILYEHLYMTSQSFGRLGVDLPAHRHLPAMVHPEDMGMLRCFLSAAARRVSVPLGPVPVRFAAVNRGWRTLAISGTGVRLSETEEPQHVLCRVSPTGT